MAETESKAGAAPRLDSTLTKGLGILEGLARSRTGMGVTELSREQGLTKSNAFRILQTLSALGYVRMSADKRYSATLKVWQLGQAVVDHLALPAIAAPYLKELAEETGEAVYLAVPDGRSILYIDKIDSRRPISSFTPKGGSAPMHCTGTGKALLAARYDVLRDQIRDHLNRFTDKTITTLDALDRDVSETRIRGYAYDRGEYRERILSFGAAVTLPNGDPVAAIGVSLPDVNLAPRKPDEMGALVMQAAKATSKDLLKP